MPKNITQYSLLISCPGDVKEEIDIIEKCVERFNTLYSDVLGIAIVTKHWRKNSYPQSGDKPQSILNSQFVNESDAAVAILWTKFGTPTDEYGSGTEEEVEIMLASEKQVFMYFSDKPVNPSVLNSDDYKKVLAFKEKYKNKGLYFTYSSGDEFASLFFAHLSQFFLSEQRVTEVRKERHSELKLVGINLDCHIDDAAHIIDFIPNVAYTTEKYLDRISGLFDDISAIKLDKRNERTNSLSSLSFSFNKPVDINEHERDIIQSMADILKMEIPEDFFSLGNLSQSTAPTDILGRKQLTGKDLEKTKYRKILKLCNTISKCSEWIPIENAFSGKRCLKLALQNYGTAIDEDIEITLLIPHDCYTPIGSFPTFTNDQKGYLLNDCDMSTLFGISSTSEYIDYSASIVNNAFSSQPHSTNFLPGYTPDYSDDYINELRNVFCYDVYDEGDHYILKLKIDYIKHNTTVAFPSVIFVQDSFNYIDYSITSRNAPDVIRGRIEVV